MNIIKTIQLIRINRRLDKSIRKYDEAVKRLNAPLARYHR